MSPQFVAIFLLRIVGEASTVHTWDSGGRSRTLQWAIRSPIPCGASHSHCSVFFYINAQSIIVLYIKITKSFDIASSEEREWKEMFWFRKALFVLYFYFLFFTKPSYQPLVKFGPFRFFFFSTIVDHILGFIQSCENAVGCEVMTMHFRVSLVSALQWKGQVWRTCGYNLGFRTMIFLGGPLRIRATFNWSNMRYQMWTLITIFLTWPNTRCWRGLSRASHLGLLTSRTRHISKRISHYKHI